jgi:hypothetical protein
MLIARKTGLGRIGRMRHGEHRIDSELGLAAAGYVV